jgi:hypothetical protein
MLSEATSGMRGVRAVLDGILGGAVYAGSVLSWPGTVCDMRFREATM